MRETDSVSEVSEPMSEVSRLTSEILEIPVAKVVGSQITAANDTLSVEEPLEIRVTTKNGTQSVVRPIAVTMRTPGEDTDLAVGFLYTEGVIAHIDRIKSIKKHGCNVIEVILRDDVTVDSALFERHSFVASSCGVCGKRSIEAVKTRRNYNLSLEFPTVDNDVVHSLPEKLRAAQKAFGTTGGIHASGLFDTSGTLLLIREDVGRHNALDKLIGASASLGMLPLEDRIILVSGRASFELVQKAAHAGASILAAVGAPSSLAVQLAEESGMTLLGFVRGNRFNIYTGVAKPAAAAESCSRR
jgi:FdhD protein